MAALVEALALVGGGRRARRRSRSRRRLVPHHLRRHERMRGMDARRRWRLLAHAPAGRRRVVGDGSDAAERADVDRYLAESPEWRAERDAVAYARDATSNASSAGGDVMLEWSARSCAKYSPPPATSSNGSTIA